MATRKLLLLSIMILSNLSTKNLNPSNDKAENPKVILHELQNLKLDMEIFKDKLYDYIETLEHENIPRKERLRDIVIDLYEFEKIKKDLILQNEVNMEDKVDEIFNLEKNALEVVDDANKEAAFQHLMMNLRKSLLASMSKHQLLNAEKNELFKKQMDEMTKKLIQQGMTPQKAKDEVLKDPKIVEKLRDMNLPPIVKHLFKRIDEMRTQVVITKNTNQVVINLKDRIEQQQKHLDEHRDNVKNYNDLRKDPSKNLKDVISYHINAVANPNFTVDNDNIDLLINRLHDMIDAYVIVSKKSNNQNLIDDLFEFVDTLLAVPTEPNEKKESWKLISSRLILTSMNAYGYGNRAFEYVIHYFRTFNGKRVPSPNYEQIFLRNMKLLKFKFSPEEDADKSNRTLFMDMVNQFPDNKFTMEVENKLEVLENFEHFFNIPSSLRSSDFPYEFVNLVFNVIPNTPVDMADNLFLILHKFRIKDHETLDEGVNPAMLFDVYIDTVVDILEHDSDLNRYYALYKLVLVKVLEKTTTQDQYWEPSLLKDLVVAEEIIPKNEQLIKIIYALYRQKIPKIKREFNTTYYLGSFTSQYFDLNNLNWNTPEFEDIPTKNDDHVKNTLEDLVGGFSVPEVDSNTQIDTNITNNKKIVIDEVSSEEDKRKNKKDQQKSLDDENDINESSEEDKHEQVPLITDDGKNLVNVVYGEIDPALQQHLESSTDLRAFASKVVTVEETEDTITQTVYVYVQRVSSPCYDENLTF
jgi:hypothetical protein